MQDLAHDGSSPSRNVVRAALRKNLWAAIAVVLAVVRGGRFDPRRQRRRPRRGGELPPEHSRLLA